MLHAIVMCIVLYVIIALIDLRSDNGLAPTPTHCDVGGRVSSSAVSTTSDDIIINDDYDLPLGSLLRGGGPPRKSGKGTKNSRQDDNALLSGLEQLLSNFAGSRKNPPNDSKPTNNSNNNAGLLGALRRLVKRNDSISADDLIGKLENIIQAAKTTTTGNLDPKGRKARNRNSNSDADKRSPNDSKTNVSKSKGKGSGKSNTNSSPTNNARSAAADYDDNTYAGKVKNSFGPTHLSTTHWNGTMATTETAAAIIAAAADGAHIVIGPMTKWPQDLLQKEPPTNGTITFVGLCDPPADAIGKRATIRAPVLDRREAPKVMRCSTLQKGAATDALKWKTVSAEPLPASSPTTVIKLQIFKDLADDALWNAVSKNSITAARAWLKQIKLPDNDVISLWAKIYPDGSSIIVNARIKQTNAVLVENSSGVNGWLAKALPKDPASEPIQTGAIQWIQREDNELGHKFLLRSRRLAEQQPTCKGLAFSGTMSLGLRLAPGTVATSFYASGFPSCTTDEDALHWLQRNSWSEVTMGPRYVRGKGDHQRVAFRFRGRHLEGARDVWSLNCDVPDGSTAFIDVTPWRSTQKVKPSVNLVHTENPPTRAQRKAATDAVADSAKVATSDVSYMRSDVDASVQPLDGEGNQVSQAKHAKIDEIKSFDRLGLTPTRVPKDGTCL